jgi:hypothetical protein
MKKKYDNVALIKACQTANLLVQDLRELVKSNNPQLLDIASKTLQQAVQLEQRLISTVRAGVSNA